MRTELSHSLLLRPERRTPSPEIHEDSTLIELRRDTWSVTYRKIVQSLRAIGLGSILTLLDPKPMGKEEKKIIAENSVWVVLARSSIHFLPFGISTFLLYYNFVGAFVGTQLFGSIYLSDEVKFQLLQFAAKAHELLIVGSTAHVVFHMVKYQLLWGSGMPLGLVASGFSFSDLSFFWSLEFWGSFGYPASRWLKFRIFGLLGLAGLIAATAGPSSAILLLPRNRTWSTGNIPFNLNGTVEQLWPSTLTLDHLGGPNCSSFRGVMDSKCAAGGYGPLYYHYTQPGAASQFEHFTIDIADSASTRLLEGNFRTTWEFRSETWTRAPHMATAAVEEVIRQLWTYCLRYVTVPPADRFWFSDIRTVDVQTKIPIVRTVCIPSENLQANQTHLPFPILPEYDFWYSNDTELIGWLLDGTITQSGQFGKGPSGNYSVGQSLERIWTSANTLTVRTAESFSLLKTTWLTLPLEFGSTTAGLAILFPPTNNTDGGRAVSCSIDARWANGSNWVTSSQPAWQWQRTKVLVPTKSTIKSMRRFGTQQGIDLFLPKNDGTWSRIATHLDYLQGLTPPISNTTSVTTLEKILTDSILTVFDPKALDFSDSFIYFTPFIEHVVSTVLVDAIARTGAYLQQPSYDIYSGVLDHINERFCDPLSSTAVSASALEQYDATGNSSTPMIMETSVEGYAYQLSGGTMYFAVFLLILHCLMALGHVFWMLWTRRTITAWDKIPELLVLAHNSRPSLGSILKNTSAGISKKGTFELTTKIEVTNGEKVEMTVARNHLIGNRRMPEKVIPGQMY